MRAEGGTLPSGYAGGGVEVGWFSTYGRVLSYDRTAGADKYLYLRGSAVIIQEGGNTVLTVDGGDVYTQGWTSYASTVNGWSSFTTKLVYYKTVGDLVYVWFHIDGTSNQTYASMTVPYTSNSSIQSQGVIRIINSGTSGSGIYNHPTSSSQVTFFRTVGGASWTASGQKLVIGQFVYQRA
jgi:hypothetical protein